MLLTEIVLIPYIYLRMIFNIMKVEKLLELFEAPHDNLSPDEKKAFKEANDRPEGGEATRKTCKLISSKQCFGVSCKLLSKLHSTNFVGVKSTHF